MALITCPECKHRISDKAGVCPNCGYPVADMKNSLSEKILLKLRDSYLGKLWQGKYPLRAAFWLCFFLTFFSLNILITLFPDILRPWILPPTYGSVSLIMLVYAIFMVYLFICVVGIWRSAADYRGVKALAAAARLFVCCYTVSSLYLTITGFILPLFQLLKLVN